MNNDRKPQGNNANTANEQCAEKPVNNPFENGQSVEADIKQMEGEVNSEQQFKEALTERD